MKASQRLQNLSDTPMYVKALIYGDSGVGKTWLACTAPTPLLILSEWAIAKPTLDRLRKERGIDPPTILVNSWDDFMEAYKYAAANVKKYETIVVDGLTDLNDRAIEEILREAVNNPRVERRTAHDPDTLEIGDWNRVANRTMYAVRLFRDLPAHVVMTALAQEVKNEMCTTPMVAPSKACRRMPSQFNFVGYLTAETRPKQPSVRKLHLDSHMSYVAKNPGNALPAVINDPDMGVIIQQVVEFLRGHQGDAEQADEVRQG